MVPTAFEESNIVFGPPAGMTEDDVHSLSCARVEYDGQPAIVTCWKLTQEELEEFNRTGRVWFVCMGEGLPPHLMLGNNPFEQGWAKPKP